VVGTTSCRGKRCNQGVSIYTVESKKPGRKSNSGVLVPELL